METQTAMMITSLPDNLLSCKPCTKDLTKIFEMLYAIYFTASQLKLVASYTHTVHAYSYK